MDKICQCHHKKQESVVHIHQDNKEAVSTSKEADKSVLQCITTLCDPDNKRIVYVCVVFKLLFYLLLCTCFIVVSFVSLLSFLHSPFPWLQFPHCHE